MLTLRAGTRLTHETEVRRSRFVTTLARTDDEAAARALIGEVRSAAPQARHHCSAFLIEEVGRNPLQHSSDDGEPSGTAGAPMLEAIRASGVHNVTAVVTRWFGGVLLGTGGLVRAYSGAVSEALARAPLAHTVELQLLATTLPPGEAGRVEADLRAAGVQVVDLAWGQEVVLRVAVDEDGVTAMSDRLSTLTRGVATFRSMGRVTREVDGATPRT
ncbi:IMPACT family protein [Actinomyces provencensis]|uniref:IMPACT family protein n=1 Tax=Actinomyces provencensis TaxID=1720198 RepID=UPI00096A7DA0|nr:YigZ family protein [Actinomyces provencensis]